ncbi:hypothetical protein ElyMa_000463600 [Elysia marginata]|uniref:Endonuclease/exonuclease/phosphatase domain-containing protein n=1 Tax=Elysia marginata TaxID=1093978 RepID=A0AAV4FQT9_9GAST|nr:hypothetical protein ElyMa_000463600 [Elysia marginata]
MPTVAFVPRLEMMLRLNYDSSHGASSVESQAEEVAGSLPRRSPPKATGKIKHKMKLKKKIKIVPWNCGNIRSEQLQQMKKPMNVDIHIACLQESHAQPQNM